MPRNRTLAERVCAQCQAPFTCRSDTKQRFCSLACSALAQQVRVERTCRRCQVIFYEVPAKLRRGWGLYCSFKCKQGTPEQRFWQYVQKTPTCWCWTGYSLPDGYGRIRWRRKMELAHRVSWEIHNGPIPRGKLILHKCSGGGNAWCVNPAHLEPGDYVENADDAIRAGRHWSQTGVWSPKRSA